MGLDFSVGSAHWAYSGFHRFRQRLATAIGIDLDAMSGFTTPGIPWSSLPPHPLHALLDHSDCDGDLSPAECRAIAPILRDIAKDWQEQAGPHADWSLHYDGENAYLLADAMEQCAAKGVALRFR